MKIIRLFKTLILISCLTAVLLLAAILAAPFLIQTENIRSQATKLITQWSDGQIRIHGPIQLTTFMGAALTAEQIEFDQGKDHGPVKRVSAKALRIELSLMNLMSGKLKFKELTLVEPQIEIQVPDKPLNLAFAEQFRKHPLFGIVKHSSLYVFAIENGVADVQHMNASRRFTMMNGQLIFDVKADHFSGNIRFDANGDDQRFSFKSYRIDPSTQQGDYKLQYHFDNRLASLSFHGIFNPSGKLKVQGRQFVEIHDLDRLVKWTGAKKKFTGGLNAIRLDAAMDVDGRQINFSDAYITLDGNSAYGSLGVKLENKPLIDGTLAFSQLSLAPYLQKIAVLEQPKSSEDVSGFNILKSFDADLRISANRIDSPYLTANNSAVMISVRSSRLLADVVDTEICDGSAYGRLEINAEAPSPQLSINGALLEVSTGRCFENFSSGLMQGRASADVHLTANGASWKSVLGSLQGKWSVKMTSGGQVSMDLPHLFSVPGKRSIQGWKTLADGETSFDLLNITSNMTNGTATINTLMRSSKQQKFSGQGRIDLVGNHMDYLVTMASTAPKVLSSKKSKGSMALRVKGPWRAPEITMNREGAVQEH